MIVQNGTLDDTDLTPDSVALMQQNQLPNGIRAVNGDGFGSGFKCNSRKNKQSPLKNIRGTGLVPHISGLIQIKTLSLPLTIHALYTSSQYSLRPRIYKSIQAMDADE